MVSAPENGTNTHHDITLRALHPDDWAGLRAMRLKAVTHHTGYFMGKPDEVAAHPPEYWQEILDGKGKCVFGLFDGAKMIGITAIFTFRLDPTGKTGDMAFNYIEPEYRGHRYVDLFYDARIQWALEHTDFTKIFTAHRVGNLSSQKAIIRNGFQYVETVSENWPDGTTEDELRYELDLTKLRKQPSSNN